MSLRASNDIGRMGCDEALHDGQEVADSRIGDAVADIAAFALGVNVTTPLQTGELVADSALRHPEMRDDFADGPGSGEQIADDAKPRRVSHRREEASEQDLLEAAGLGDGCC